jgi:hypothetical protein
MPRHHAISQVITELIESAEGHGGISIQECLTLLGAKSILLVLLLFSLTNAVPLGIPILSMITGIPIIILGAQLLISPDKIWLPRKIADYRLKPGKPLLALKRLLPRLHRIEKHVKPRLWVLSESPVQNLLGLIFIGLGLLLVLPIPFTNAPAGLALSMLAAGLITRDGLLVLGGIFLSLLAAAIVLVTVGLLGDGLQKIFS